MLYPLSYWGVRTVLFYNAPEGLSRRWNTGAGRTIDLD